MGRRQFDTPAIRADGYPGTKATPPVVGSHKVGSAYGNRTRLSALRGPRPKPIDERANRKPLRILIPPNTPVNGSALDPAVREERVGGTPPSSPSSNHSASSFGRSNSFNSCGEKQRGRPTNGAAFENTLTTALFASTEQ